MVCEWGMSEKLGPLSYEKREGPVFLGMQGSTQKDYSDSKAQEIDAEIFSLVTGGHQRALKILKENEQVLHNMAEALLEWETIDAEDVQMLVDGKSLAELRQARGERLEAQNVERMRSREEDRQKSKSDAKAKGEGGSGGGKDPVGNPGPVTA